MAAENEYVVILDQESNNNLPSSFGLWDSAATGSKVLTAPKRCIMVTVKAETRAESIRGVKQLFPGWLKTKVISANKEETEEG